MKQITCGHAAVPISLKYMIRCCTAIHSNVPANGPLWGERQLFAQVVATMNFSQRRMFARNRGKVGSNQKTVTEMASSMPTQVTTTNKEERHEATGEEEKTTTKKKLSQWGIIKEVWRQYMWTWKDFFTAKDKLPPDHLIYRTKEEEEQMRETKIDGKDTDTKRNVYAIFGNLRRNISQLRSEGPKAAQQISDLAKQDELKIWVGDLMRLAADCMTHFMQGYREGRDAEIQNVLSDKYFPKNDDTDKIQTVDDKVITRIRGRRRQRRRRNFDNEASVP